MCSNFWIFDFSYVKIRKFLISVLSYFLARLKIVKYLKIFPLVMFSLNLRLLVWTIKVLLIVGILISSVFFEISSKRNQCLQYSLNAFYHNIGKIKKGTILWSVLRWGQFTTYCSKDNTFIFNRMLGYNTAFYNDVDKKWQWDRVNDLSATYYIKYSTHRYSYIQLMGRINGKAFIILKRRNNHSHG